ncbi:Integrator complex subunit 10-like [Oopsacas minuta]|uniref:Integrator complex subunit 10 n=1 Tax=Oopsacas minuta TaxID=111878 RepID=A0AAV7K0J6_9METZ|nr:Integrator complex subunit 10-like [Oopsacas minuta]
MDPTIMNILDKCDRCLYKGDRNGAKSWILTASTLFAGNFTIQLKTLFLYKSCDDLIGARKYLEYIIREFPEEPELWEFLEGIALTLLSQDPPKDTFRDVFLQLPVETQKQALREAANKVEDLMSKSQILLALMTLFPETTSMYGLEALDILAKGASTVNTDVLINPFKKILVCDIIPKLLACNDIIVDKPIIRAEQQQNISLKTGHFCQWLELSTNFYTIGTEILFRKEIDDAIFAENGWSKLYELLCLIAKKCQWPEIVGNINLSTKQQPMVRWQALEEISNKKSLQVAIGSFYIAVLLFFQTAWEYYENVLRIAGDSTNSYPAFLVIIAHPHTDQLNLKPETMEFDLNQSFEVQEARIRECLMAASKCWQFLHSSETYKSEFQRIIQQWGIEEWHWINLFLADMHTYHLNFTEALGRLQYEESRNKDNLNKALAWRIEIQRNLCLLQRGGIDAAGFGITKVLKDILNHCNYQYCPPAVYKASNRKTTFSLLRTRSEDLIPYMVHLTIAIIDSKLVNVPNQTILGGLIVLIQYAWHNQQQTFTKVIDLVRSMEQFNYPNLIKYLFNVDLLEELMCIINEGKVKLNILPKSTRQKTKSIKDELRNAIEKQISLSQSEVGLILGTFLKEAELYAAKTTIKYEMN